MGYESQLIIGLAERPKRRNSEERYVQIIAHYDLCKMGSGPFSALVQAARRESEDFCIFEGPFGHGKSIGNVVVRADMYGHRLVAIPLPELIEVLKAEADTPDPYRRLLTLLPMLEAFEEHRRIYDTDHEELVVLHYGH